MAANPFEHVMDMRSNWPLFETLGLRIPLPLGLSKFMILELIAAVVIAAVFIPLTRRAAGGEPVRGPFWNAFESLLTFIRDQVAVPAIGEHDADRFVPFLWTIFLFVLACNLLGMFPFLGSPTASLTVTGALALCSFVVIHGAAIAKMGVMGYAKSYIPHLEGMGPAMRLPLVGMIVLIEFVGNFIKAGVLAVRLFANMFAGHTVLAFILLFIVMARTAGWYLFWPVTISSVLGVTALSLLELFVAFLQAYIFVFLTAIFLGGALHPAH